MRHRTAFGRSARHTYGVRPDKSHCFRMCFVLFVLMSAFAGIGVWLFKLHADPHARYEDEDGLHDGHKSLEIPRGNICDRNGALLAKDRKIGSIWADTRYVRDPSTTALHLCALFGLDEDGVFAELTKRDAKQRPMKFVWIKRWLTEEEQQAFEALSEDLRGGLSIRTESVRFYPEGPLAAHVLGFANRDGEGCEGMERAYDKYLRSIPGRHESRVDANRNLLPSLTLDYVPPKGGHTVSLTIDKAIQRKLEQELEKGLERAEAPSGMGIVMDPRTGAILALACRPAFDPNEYWNVKPELYKNRAAVDVFEPGSSFKIVTTAAALEQGLVTPDSLIDCEGGSFNPYGHRIRDFHKFDVIPLTEFFAHSSNIGAIKVAAKLGEEALDTWIRRFGFGRPACDDLLVQSRGIFRPHQEWSRLSMGSLPMGQEIAVTILQLARAFCVIANGGRLVEPYLVERVVSRDDEIIYRREYREPERVISESTAATMKELCHLVVRDGTGKDAGIPEFRVGGKTGTAQIARPDGGGFFKDKYTTIFAGFAPVRDPRVCAVIVIHEPAIRLHYGGYVCGPVFREVVRDALIHLNCPEDPVVEESGEEDVYTRYASNESASEEDASLEPVIIADADTVVDRTSAGAEQASAGSLDNLDLLPIKAPFVLENHDKLPNFAGMTKRQAKIRIDELGLNWEPHGAGRVVLQEPPPGTPLREVNFCRLVFSNQALSTENEARSDPQLARM